MLERLINAIFGKKHKGMKVPGNQDHIPGVDDEETLNNPSGAKHWEQQVIENIAYAVLREQSRNRHWKMIMFFIIFAYIMTSPFILKAFNEYDQLSEHTALVKINGQIAQNSTVNIDIVKKGLQEAFKNSKSKGVVLRINSPGGSPVQSDIINQEIKRLREKYPNKKLIAVVTDMAASGGYYIAAAADEIYANRSSIIGSIGVRMDAFGFKQIMTEHGVERRLYTAGKYKGMLDSFSDVKPEEEEHVQKILDRLHEHFIARVKEGRGDRLKEHDDMFSGLFWTGDQALELGLIDGYGDADYVAREIIHAEKLVDMTKSSSGLDLLFKRMGSAILEQFEWTLR